MGIGLICGLYLFADIYSDFALVMSNMVGEWSNVATTITTYICLVRESGDVAT